MATANTKTVNQNSIGSVDKINSNELENIITKKGDEYKVMVSLTFNVKMFGKSLEDVQSQLDEYSGDELFKLSYMTSNQIDVRIENIENLTHPEETN